jgi:tryptophanyl-tRNA synthetase
MSASDASSAVFVTDGPKEIKDKVTRFAFSGGGATAEEQRARGADLEVDVPWKVGGGGLGLGAWGGWGVA